MQYERSIFSGLKVIGKVKVFVYAANADADADTRAVTLAPRTFDGLVSRNTINMCNMKALSLLVRKLWQKFLFTHQMPTRTPGL